MRRPIFRFFLSFIIIAIATFLLQWLFLSISHSFLGYSVLSYFGNNVAVFVENSGYGIFMLVFSLSNALVVAFCNFISRWLSKSLINRSLASFFVLILTLCLALFVLGMIMGYTNGSAWGIEGFDLFRTMLSSALYLFLYVSKVLILAFPFNVLVLAIASAVVWLELSLLVVWHRKYAPSKELDDTDHFGA